MKQTSRQALTATIADSMQNSSENTRTTIAESLSWKPLLWNSYQTQANGSQKREIQHLHSTMHGCYARMLDAERKQHNAGAYWQVRNHFSIGCAACRRIAVLKVQISLRDFAKIFAIMEYHYLMDIDSLKLSLWDIGSHLMNWKMIGEKQRPTCPHCSIVLDARPGWT